MWDAGEQRWLRARPGMVFTAGIERLTPGMGLWLQIGGGEPVTWSRAARADSVLLELHAGVNLVGWTGRTGTPAADAVARFGDALVRASRWNAEAQRQEHYRPGAPDSANTLRALVHGDAIEVELTADARWWQPGATPPPVEFLVAVNWLVGHSTEESLVDFFKALAAPSATWQEAFETAFGIAPGDFYAAFEAYRAEAAPPLPHLTDDGDEPVLAFLGDVPSAVQAAVRAEFAKVRAFFTDRFGAETPDFTAFVGADAESAAATHLRVFGGEIEDGFCDRSIRGLVVIVVLGCGESPLHYLDRHYFNAVRAKIAPWGSLPAVPEGSNRLGPDWLLLATESYTESAYRAAAGSEAFSRIREREIALARRTAKPLRSMETRAGVDAAGFWEARALAFLAAERLAEWAGEPALFAYYRALPSSAGWREAFETAFGIAAGEFYATFEPYRATAAPPR